MRYTADGETECNGDCDAAILAQRENKQLRQEMQELINEYKTEIQNMEYHMSGMEEQLGDNNG